MRVKDGVSDSDVLRIFEDSQNLVFDIERGAFILF